MKNNLTSISLLILLASVVSLGQELAPVEVSGTYQFTRGNGVNVPAGYDASLDIPTDNWVRGNWLGLLLDFNGASKTTSNVTQTLYTFGLGPQFTIRLRRLQPYFRLPIGAAKTVPGHHLFAGGPSSSMVAPGAGIDLHIRDVAWLRVGASYPISNAFPKLNNIQAIVGLTFKFGAKREIPVQATLPTPAGRTIPAFGIVLDNNMQIMQFLPDSLLSNRGLEVETRSIL
jgi:hypothetical protein